MDRSTEVIFISLYLPGCRDGRAIIGASVRASQPQLGLGLLLRLQRHLIPQRLTLALALFLALAPNLTLSLAPTRTRTRTRTRTLALTLTLTLTLTPTLP